MPHNRMQSKKVKADDYNLIKVYLALMPFISRLQYVVYEFRFTCVIMAAYFHHGMKNKGNLQLFILPFILNFSQNCEI